MVTITFRDGSEKEYPKGTAGMDIAKDKGIRKAIAVRIKDHAFDLSVPIEEDSKVQFLTFDDEEGREIFRHSSAHVLAMAVKEIYPDVMLTIGPVVEDGFYYDFDRKEPFKPEDLEKIEKKMKEIVREDIPFERKDVSYDEAKELMKGNPYKLELAEEHKGESISFYSNGDFIDLCRGPHVPSTGYIRAFKLTKIAGAYWRGDAKNRQLQRIYGISFPDKKDLKEHLTLVEQAEKRDHRRLGKQLDLFSFHEEGPGFPFFHPKGTLIFNLLLDFWRKEHTKAGYVEVKTPMILNKALWERSGHWSHYKENMYFTKIDGQEYAIKPMNCPGGMLIYKTKVHSYRELPLRCGEIGLVHRHELSGVLAGLFRVRAFTQDDAHIFMTEEQMKDEIIGVIDMVDHFYRTFGFEYHVELSTRPENPIGSDGMWATAEKGLEDALKAKKMDYKINDGDGAFYGPKIDFHIKDCIGRTWQCATIQLDFTMPEKFDLTYEGKDGKKHRPVMIHRVLYGSIERFLGILIEHYAGRFPLWLAPVQAAVLNIADRHADYANDVYNRMNKEGLRVELDLRAETLPHKVRDAQIQQVPVIIVVGDREVKDGTVTARNLEGKTFNAVKVEKLIGTMNFLIEEKSQAVDLSECYDI